MEWKSKPTYFYAHPFTDIDHNYRVFEKDKNNIWVANYTPNLNRYAGYLSSNLRIESYYGDKLKDNCKFPTKEEAMKVCERHYKLLLLQ
jgi:hypothetical protein